MRTAFRLRQTHRSEVATYWPIFADSNSNHQTVTRGRSTKAPPGSSPPTRQRIWRCASPGGSDRSRAGRRPSGIRSKADFLPTRRRATRLERAALRALAAGKAALRGQRLLQLRRDLGRICRNIRRDAPGGYRQQHKHDRKGQGADTCRKVTFRRCVHRVLTLQILPRASVYRRHRVAGQVRGRRAAIFRLVSAAAKAVGMAAKLSMPWEEAAAGFEPATQGERGSQANLACWHIIKCTNSLLPRLCRRRNRGRLRQQKRILRPQYTPEGAVRNSRSSQNGRIGRPAASFYRSSSASSVSSSSLSNSSCSNSSMATSTTSIAR